MRKLEVNRREVVEPYDIELSPEIEGNTSLDFLQAIYRSADQPMNRRMRAAIAALPFEHPKLSVTVNVGPNVGFAKQLEAAREIRDQLAVRVVIDGTAERIEASCAELVLSALTGVVFSYH